MSGMSADLNGESSSVTTNSSTTMIHRAAVRGAFKLTSAIRQTKTNRATSPATGAPPTAGRAVHPDLQSAHSRINGDGTPPGRAPGIRRRLTQVKIYRDRLVRTIAE
jgi:hypothetical protein